MPRPRVVTRHQVLVFRRAANGLDRRLPHTPDSLRDAAWTGLTDSMPRAAVLALHARVADVQPDDWAHPEFVQVWGLRYSTYVVPARDRALFTLSRLPDDRAGLARAAGIADRLEVALAGRTLPDREAAALAGVVPTNALRYAGPTGRVLIRWEGARAPLVWMVDEPATTPAEARLALARRFLQRFGPTTVEAFGEWAGIRPPRAAATWAQLAPELVPVRTPVGDAWILVADEPALAATAAGSSATASAAPPAPARLLPSGDALTLLQGADRELLVPDRALRARLWTPRVWPGALLVDGELVGTWRRDAHVVTVEPWRGLGAAECAAVEEEAASLPLPGLAGRIGVRWEPPVA